MLPCSPSHRLPFVVGVFPLLLLLGAASCDRDDDLPMCIDPVKREASKSQNCPEHLNPVCGCDKVTYGNPCFAEAAGVTRTMPGKCD